MKKALSVLILAALVLTLGVAASGCKSAETDTGDAGSYSDAIPGGSADVSAEVLEALTNSGKISVYFLETNNPMSGDEKAWLDEFAVYFKEVYGGEIDRRELMWEKWEENYITQFASNDNADLIYLFEKNFPKFANRDMVYSIEEMQEKGVVGFDHPMLMETRDLVYNNFVYNGEHYAFATNNAEADMIFVNEDLFKKYEVKSPTEYYNEGQWNWENFEKCAKALTRDSDGDGSDDIFGFYGWDGNFFVNAAGGELVSLLPNGKLQSNLNSTEVIQGLENYANVFGRLKCASELSLRSGKLGMIAWMPSNEDHNLIGAQGFDKYTFEWGMVPFPIDERTNSRGIRSGKCSGWTVSTTAENLQGCVNYMIAMKTYEKMSRNPNSVALEDVFTPDQIDMINDCTRQAVLPIYQGVGTLWQNQWGFWNTLKAGTAASEVVGTYSSLFAAQVEMENNYSS